MAYYDDLLDSARKLLGNARGRPRYSDCNRAVSTAYYSVFDFICRQCAIRVCGPLPMGQRPSDDWVRVYRSLDHAQVGSILIAIAGPKSTHPLAPLSMQFQRLKEARLEADYDPSVTFSKVEALALIDNATTAIAAFNNASRDVQTKFLVELLVLKPKR